MIFTLFLSSILAANQQAMDCSQIFDPAYCTGPAAGAPGHVCQWDAQEYECKSVGNKLEDTCKSLSTNQAACNAKTGCHFDVVDFECKGAHEIEAADHADHGAFPAATNALPNSHATATGFPAGGNGFNSASSGMNTFPTQPAANGFNTPPTQPAAGGFNTFPTQPAASGFQAPPTQPAATGFNSVPTQPAHNAFPAAPQPATGNTGAFPQANTGAHPQTNTGAFPQPGLPHSTAHTTTFLSTSLPPATTKKVNSHTTAVSTSLPHTHTTSGSHGKPAQTTLALRNFCKSLPEVQCFGPAMERGMMCFWDAEDMECSEAPEGNVEAICAQFGRDPLKCDAHENCFWDAKDMECSELKGFGPFKQKPVLPVMCQKNNNLNTCASQSTCFWDTNGNQCINIIQASNVCSVLNSPQVCSTNPFCHWRNNGCSIAQIPAPFAGLNFAGNQLRAPRPEEETNTNSQSTDYLIMFACGFSGALLGLLFALAVQTMCQRKNNQEDDFYRDIVLDEKSHRRQMV